MSKDKTIYTLNEYIADLIKLRDSHGGECLVICRGVGGEYPAEIPQYRNENEKKEIIVDEWA